MKIAINDSKNNSITKEYEILKSLENPYIIKHFGENFFVDGFYCFLTEYCEVNIN